MAAKYILAVLAVIFALIAASRWVVDRGRVAGATRTWLVIAIIFGAVSLALFTLH